MRLKPPKVNPSEGDVAMRYPGGDPENGPAYPQRFVAGGWECNDHVWNYGACCYCGERDPRVSGRKLKRMERKMGMADPVYDAYLSGQCGLIRNYPPGRRNDEYQRGRQC